MKQLLIGDCHFGISSNSVVWLETQLDYFNKQIIDILSNKEIDEVVFLGDLFDIRYSINQQIGIEAKNLIRNLITKYPNIKFIFIAGNHDFYSPLEEFHNYNAYDLIFGKEFEEYYNNIKFVIHTYYYDEINNNLYLPWYYTENFNNFSNILLELKSKNLLIENIFCHSDLSAWNYSYTSLVENSKIWSGHIHYEWKSNNMHNTGSTFAFNFNDVNQDKFVYIIENGNIIDCITNNITPKFKYFKNEEIFNLTEEDFKNSFIKLLIFNSNINKAKYIERISEIKKEFADYSVKVQSIDDSMSTTFELTYFNTNISKYISDNIPEYLNEKYNIIKEKISNNNEDK